VADARYVFLTAGSLEGEELFVSLEAVVEELRDRSRGELAVGYRVYENEGLVPMLGFHEGLRTLFDGWMPYDILESPDWSALVVHYEEMSDRLGYSVKIPSAIGGYTADLLLQAGDTTAAIGALRDLTEAYPGWESFRSRLEELTGG
jgi:hypothetical protein